MQDRSEPIQPELPLQEAPEAAPQSAAAELAGQPADAKPSLEDLLKKAELDAAEHRDAWLRARAEADNIRKRAQLDIANAHKYGLETFSSELLGVKDSLESTLVALTAENASLDQLKSGAELTLKLLAQTFEKFNIKEINPASGDKFDPHKHQAMCTLESDAQPNTVVHVMQKGYQLNDRVIRPALVTVAKAKEG